jgi:outer membrane protein W
MAIPAVILPSSTNADQPALWTVRAFGGLSFAPQSSKTTNPNRDGFVESATFNFGTGLALGIAGEYRLSSLIGIPLDVSGISVDSQIVYQTTAGPIEDENPVGGMIPILTGINFHFLDPAGRFDLQLSPLIGVAFFTKTEIRKLLADEIDLGVELGLALDATLHMVAVEPGFIVSVMIRSVFTPTLNEITIKVDDQDLTFDLSATPILVGLGAGYRF